MLRLKPVGVGLTPDRRDSVLPSGQGNTHMHPEGCGAEQKGRG